MIKYKPRLTAADMPANDNKYYIRKADGGYSPCIKGNPQHKHLTALSNCVGWAIGRMMEILQTQTNPLPHLNAEDFYNNAKLPKGQVPKNGAVICWRKGKLWNGNDGAGHVAIVEKVISEDEIITSESAYGGMAFYTKTRKKGNGNWGAGANYQFMGFIYPPEECVPEDEDKAQNYTVTIENVPTKADAEELLTAAKAKGYNGFITEPENPEPKPEPKPALKSVDELAVEVIRGLWGNGAERKERLEAAGYDYEEVQQRVDEMLSGEKPEPEPELKSIDEVACEVIRGEWGNGAERKERLEAAGYDYWEVQHKVDEILRG